MEERIMERRAGTIHLRSVGGGHAVAWDRTYFAFGDGRLAYDCAACGAKCCRGYGYSLAAGHELEAHLSSRPAIKVFLEAPTSRSESNFRVHNCAPSCFFLDQRNLCSLQTE